MFNAALNALLASACYERRRDAVGRSRNMVTAAAIVLLGACPHLQSVSAQGTTAAGEPHALYASVLANLVRSQQSAPLFAYKERRTTLRMNPFGAIGTTGLNLYLVFPSEVPRLTYRRLLARDGQVLTEAQLARQDREYSELARRVRSTIDVASARREADRDAQHIISDIANSVDLSMDGPVQRNGRPTIAIKFRGRHDARPETSAGEIAKKFSGTIWVDPDAAEVIEVEALASDRINVGVGGLVARVDKGAAGSLNRQQIEPGLWMPTRAQIKGEGRAALYLRRLTIDYVIEWFDYQRGLEPPLER